MKRIGYEIEVLQTSTTQNARTHTHTVQSANALLLKRKMEIITIAISFNSMLEFDEKCHAWYVNFFSPFHWVAGGNLVLFQAICWCVFFIVWQRMTCSIAPHNHRTIIFVATDWNVLSPFVLWFLKSTVWHWNRVPEKCYPCTLFLLLSIQISQ